MFKFQSSRSAVSCFSCSLSKCGGCGEKWTKAFLTRSYISVDNEKLLQYFQLPDTNSRHVPKDNCIFFFRGTSKYSLLCCKERSYNEWMLKRTAFFFSKVRMLQRMRRNTILCFYAFIMERSITVFTRERLFMFFIRVTLFMLFISESVFIVFTKERLFMLFKFACAVYKS